MRCSSTGPDKQRALAVPTPSSARTLDASSTTTAKIGSHCRDSARPAAAKAKPAAAQDYEPKPSPKLTKRSKELVTLTREATTVVKFDEGWAEISYHLCGANVTRLLGFYFVGIAGLQDHLDIIHGPAIFSTLDVINKCKRRYLEPSEVRAIRQGTSQIEAIWRAQQRGSTLHE